MLTFSRCSKIFSRRRFSRYTRPRFWIILLFAILCVLIMHLQHRRMLKLFFGYEFPDNLVLMDLSKNYFYSAAQVANKKFIVNNEKCQIPDLSSLEPDISLLIKRASPYVCDQFNVTYVKDQTVIINEETLQNMGYHDMDQISCCYRTVHRVEQSEHNFDKNADNSFRFSNSCYLITKTTRPEYSFIHVICKVTTLLKQKIIYTNFHVIANFLKNEADNGNIFRKLSFWRECFAGTTKEDSYCEQAKLQGRPPNVLLIGIDSTSRLNFHRQLPKTTNSLKKEIGTVEMNGYTKVGENTFPNVVPLMSSYSTEELKTICYPDRWTPQDKCPYIWKQYSNQNYLTVHLEDSPQLTGFNYMKTGFVRPPVDIYLRPWMMAAYKDQDDAWLVDCIGYQRPEHIILNYIVDLAILSESKGIPYFLTSWLTDLTHEDMNNAQHMDTLLQNTLLKLKQKGLLQNTVLFVISDHGYRYSDVRATTSGWYEDRLPTLFIKLPDNLQKAQILWQESLEYNSKQLTTPFDIHATLQQIVNTAFMTLLQRNLSITNFSINSISPSSSLSKSFRGISLFEKIPSRSCHEAGIPKEYCTCSSPVAYTKNISLIRLGAKAVVSKINSDLPSVCSQLKVNSITASAILDENTNIKLKSQHRNLNIMEFIISLTTKPGEFRFEAFVTFNRTSDQFTDVSYIQRTNEKTRETGCLSDNQVEYELFCYCSGVYWWLMDSL